MNEKKLWTDILRHTVGAEPHTPRAQRGYRNHYCISIGSNDHQALLAMVEAGLMTAGELVSNGTQYFHATKAGCEAIGLDKSAIDRAEASNPA
jgi:hypothetical protein